MSNSNCRQEAQFMCRIRTWHARQSSNSRLQDFNTRNTTRSRTTSTKFGGSRPRLAPTSCPSQSFRGQLSSANRKRNARAAVGTERNGTTSPPMKIALPLHTYILPFLSPNRIITLSDSLLPLSATVSPSLVLSYR